MHWLQQVLRRPAAPEEPWLSQLAARLGPSEAALEVIACAALGSVVGVALFILCAELRSAGVFRRLLAPKTRRLARRPAVAAQPSTTDPAALELWERPRWLLERIVTCLASRERLAGAGALTVGELVRSPVLTDPEERSLLLQVAQAAEQIRFAPGKPTLARVEAALAAGRELLDRLEAAHPSRAPT
jgi:hypothetical protein